MARAPGAGEDSSEFPRFARFEVVRRLGRGGMGVVFEVLDRERGARVALKTLHRFDAEILLRLKDEFRALQDIRHRNLVSLGELMRDGDTWFFTMELVDGVDLLTHVRGDAGRAREEEVTRTRAAPEDTQTTEASGAQERARFDEARLREAFVQLAQAVHAVHLAGKVHRDIKPSNILVARDGRVVLLDFGVVLDAFAPEPDVAFVGTVPYMAPEQAATEDVGPPADWYSVGVVLYQCLTGRRPFEGSQTSVLKQKMTEDATPPRLAGPGIPEDLDALAVELLDRDPKRRPLGPDVIRRLTAHTTIAPSARPVRRSVPPPARGPFLGRDEELATLGEAYDQVSRGEAVVVVVEGESGVGKSALVRHFLSHLAEKESVLVLSGRCYEREVVPYKAVDGVMDALGRHLALLDETTVEPLLPGTAWLLAQVFPVLRKVAALDDAALQRRAKPDMQESRARLFATVRELFTKLGERYHLVVAIDDIHWADPDGLALLAEVLRPPLPPRVLLLATARPVAKPGVAPFGLPGDVRTVALGRLPGDQALELARLLLAPQGDVDAGVAAAIAAEAQGHPLFVDELVRHAHHLGGRAPAGAHLDDALAARVARLDPPERELLELLAVAGVSLAEETAMRAAGLDFPSFSKHAAALRAAHLARADASRGADAIEPYHDRVREAVAARLGTDARRACHARLAEALEAQPDQDPDAVATHFLEASLPARAIKHARKAADKAFEALAYDRAALLYRRAIDLAPDEAERQTMRIRLAEALANAGRGGEAAPAFLQAAARADREQALDLRRRAAEELLIAGQIDPGIAALREVLADVGLRMPSSLVAAVMALLFYRFVLWVRGMRYELRPESSIPRPARIRMDACWGVARTLSVTDPTLGSYFQTRMLLYVLRHAEAYRLVYVLALEAGYLAIAGDRNRARVERMLEQATTIARSVELPQARAVAMGAQGFAAFVLGRFPEAVELSDRAVDFVGEHAPGLFWDMRAGRLHAAWALAWMGEVKELAARLERAVSEALDRGDLAASTAYRVGTLNLAWLRTGDAAHARAIVDEATRSWTVRARHNQHYWAFFALAQIDLYEGKARDAYERCRVEIPRSRRALTFQVEILHMQALHARARAAIQLATQVAPSERASLLRVAARDADKLASTVAPYTKPLAELTRAGIAGVRGDDAASVAALERAAMGFDGASMRLHAAAARRLLGELRGGDEGKQKIAAADAWMSAQEIAEPARMTEMLAPGLRSS